MAVSWNYFNAPNFGSSGFSADTMLLLTDGSVLVHNSYHAEWYRLTPDMTQSDPHNRYNNGSWSGVLKMANTRQFFSSGVLTDGRVYVIGGEDSDAGSDTPLGEIFDPNSNSWSAMNKPAAFSWVAGDAAGCVLPDGRVLLAALDVPRTALWDPVTDVWVESGLGFGARTTSSKTGDCNEETWTLLPDGTVMAIEISNSPQGTEIYDPATDLWTPVATAPPNLAILTQTDNSTHPPTVYSPNELGPAVLLHTGVLFAVGGTGHTGLYTVGTGWAAGPDFGANTAAHPITPLMTDIDAPGCLLPSNKVLCVAGNTTNEGGANPFWSGPTTFYEFDPTGGGSLTQLPAGQQPSTNGSDTWTGRFLLLPTGQVLYTTQQSKIALFTPDPADPAPQAAWKPVITQCPAAMIAGSSYQIGGTQLNGLSQANSYGDDAQMATNYPIVQVTNTGTGAVSYLRSYNFANFGIAVGNTSTATIDIPYNIEPGAYSLVVIANAIASDAVALTIGTKDCFFIVDQSTIAQGEVQALISQNGAPAIVQQAFFVVVEGFTPAELGLTSTASLSAPPNVPAIPSPLPGKIKILFAGPVIAEDPSLPPTPQRFTFPFNIQFQDDSMFGSVTSLTLTATLTASGTTVSNGTVIALIENPNPYILHGDLSAGYPWWLSTDIRVFMVKEGERKFAVTVQPQSSGQTAQEIATQFIQQVITNLNSDPGSAAGEFDALPQDEDTPSLAISPVDSSNTPVYNFAVARVRLQDINPAANVRLFFRMWQAQQTNAAYNTTTTYPSTTNTTTSQKVPLLGVQGDEIMTIPFFASPRVDSSSVSMATQTDPSNIRTLQPDALGGVSFGYYGCWLDINQPGQALFPDRMVGGIPADIPAGPFTGMGTLLSVQQLVRSEHQCLLTEISYDLAPPIPAGADPSTSDKLAQRNLAFVDVPNPGAIESRRAPQVFEIRPTPPQQSPSARPDEIMIQWGKIPHGSAGSIYLPAVTASEILALADELYTSHRLTAADAHTVQFPIGGVTYIPVPRGTKVSFPGLLTIDLPPTVKKGDTYTATVQQITSASAPAGVVIETRVAAGTTSARYPGWRRVLGVFKLTIPVSTRQLLLAPEERRLSVLRWIEKTVSQQSRWYAVFRRYVQQVAGRVDAMGGNSATVVATSSGNWQSTSGSGKGSGSSPGGGGHHLGKVEYTGKVTAIIYDRFGDFEGFLFRTETGREEVFHCTELEIEEIVNRAWVERIVTTVIVEHHGSHRPVSIILRRVR